MEVLKKHTHRAKSAGAKVSAQERASFVDDMDSLVAKRKADGEAAPEKEVKRRKGAEVLLHSPSSLN